VICLLRSVIALYSDLLIDYHSIHSSAHTALKSNLSFGGTSSIQFQYGSTHPF
jgi:hypothetical protein